MGDEQEIASVLELLASPDADDRSAVLLVLSGDPTGEARVRAAVEALIDDRAMCRAQPPAAVTEVRWYAAHALAAERKACGIPDVVHVVDVVPPLGHGEVSALAEAAYGAAGMPRSTAERFERLRADGKLPTRALTL